MPPAPLQVMVNVVAALSDPVDLEPLVASVPDHSPEAAQEVALADDQVNVELAPAETLEGLALSVTVGGEFVAAADSEVAATREDCQRPYDQESAGAWHRRGSGRRHHRCVMIEDRAAPAQ